MVILSTLIPAICGVLLIPLGLWVYLAFSPRLGATPLLLFHLFVGVYFFLFADLWNHPIVPILQTVLFGLIFLVAVISFSWIAIRLAKIEHPFEKIFSRYFLVGHLLGFLIPFGAIIAAELEVISPMVISWVSPLTLLFPITLLMGIHNAKTHFAHSYLIQSEKRQSFGEFLMGLTHELNNPMTFVYSNIELLNQKLEELDHLIEQKNPKIKKNLEDLREISSNMDIGASRTRSLLESFRNIPSRDSRGEKEAVDLNHLLDETINLLSPRWKDRVEIVKNYYDIPKIQGYPIELGQVFTNLLSNACDATPNGGSIFVSTREGTSGVKVIIRDTGSGIPKDQTGKIFDPFFTTKEPGKGTGLGLSMSLQIVKAHKGSIEVKSEVGVGTEMTVILPYE